MSDPIQADQQKSVFTAPEGILKINDDLAITTVIERFRVPPTEQDEALSQILAFAANQWREDERCRGFMLLRSHDEKGGIAIYSQWSGAEDQIEPLHYQTMVSVMEKYERDIAENFKVAFTAQAEGIAFPGTISREVSPFVHFGVFKLSADKLEILLQRARETAPNSLVVPGLRAINFHRGNTGRLVVNVGIWQTFEHFKALHKVPGFNVGKQYYEGIAEIFKPDFFDVITVRSKQVL